MHLLFQDNGFIVFKKSKPVIATLWKVLIRNKFVSSTPEKAPDAMKWAENTYKLERNIVAGQIQKLVNCSHYFL